jgi:hypothetical protein
MGGGGSIAAMNAAIKRNEIKRDRRNYFQQKPSYTSKDVKKVYNKELSKKKRLYLRKKAHFEGKKNELLNSVILIISLALTGFVLYFLVYLLMTYFF